MINGTGEMKLIVESGATKTAWRAVLDNGEVRSAQTAGLSPTCLDPETIQSVIREAVPALNPEGKRISEVIVYGAGLVSPEATAPLAEAFGLWCPFAEMEFHSDILAAARALFGDGSGIVAIMGTGSNSCLYESGCIVANIRPGGYVLGDEGSGVALGRAFLSDFVKDLVPEPVKGEFIRESGLDYPTIVRKVYKEQAASAFLASLAPFIMERKADPYVADVLKDCIDSFLRRSLSRYAESSGTRQVGVVGSFGCACEDILRQEGSKYGLDFVRFIKSPIDELVKFHM